MCQLKKGHVSVTAVTRHEQHLLRSHAFFVGLTLINSLLSNTVDLISGWKKYKCDYSFIVVICVGNISVIKKGEGHFAQLCMGHEIAPFSRYIWQSSFFSKCTYFHLIRWSRWIGQNHPYMNRIQFQPHTSTENILEKWLSGWQLSMWSWFNPWSSLFKSIFCKFYLDEFI